MSDSRHANYCEGLRHGYEDQAKAIREILARSISDRKKLELIEQRVYDLPYSDAKGVVR